MDRLGSRRRLAIVGIDGFAPDWLDRYLDEGVMPALAAIREHGTTVPLVSTLPATTPVAWATIATGCHPSKTGIEGFLLHRPGNGLDERLSGTYADRCNAEAIWETATLSGKRACVVKFPLSYPSTTAALRIDGAAGWGGIRCLHEAASTSVSDSERDVPGGGRFVADQTPWQGAERAPLAWRARLELPSPWSERRLSVFVAITDEPSPRVVLATAPAWHDVLAILAAGEWSAPLCITGPGRRGESACAVRFKVLDVRHEGPRIRLFNTPVHELEGHSYPPERAARHLAAAGPIEEQTDPSLCLAGAIDLETQLERCRLNVDWLASVSTSVLLNEEWDLFLVHVHVVDWAHHLLHGALDPRHPAYDAAAAIRAEHLLSAHYRLADRLVAAVCEALDESDDVMVLGDHGQDLHHTTMRVNEVLASHGLLAWSGEDDAVDWTRTRAYAAGNYVYLNVAGREPTGIVAAGEVPALVERLVRILLELVDPTTGERPVLIAGPKSHFAWLGADGAGVGDVVFCLKSGYQARNDPGEVFETTVPLAEFTSGHDHFWPLDPRIETRLFARGPSFASGRRAPRASLIDVAPTICAVLGMEPPPGCQGRVMRDLLAEPLVRSPLEYA